MERIPCSLVGSKFHRRATEELGLGREGAGDQLPTCLISGQSPSQRQSQIQGTSWGQFIEDLMLIAQRRCNFHKLRLIVNTSLKDQLKSQPGLRLVSSQGGWYAHCPAIAPPKLHIGSRAGSLLLHEKSSIFDTRTHIALYCCTGRAFDPDKTGHREAIGQAFEGISYYPPSPIFFCLTIWHPQQRNWKDCVACYVVVTGYSKTPNIAKHTTGLGGGVRFGNLNLISKYLRAFASWRNLWQPLPAVTNSTKN